MADVTQEERERAAQHELPEPDAAREWLETMMLIRRFEERAGEMYAKAKVGGFLHLAIGEEATIVGAVARDARRGLPDLDLPLARPRAGARHRPRTRVMAELFGRERRRARTGRGGSMHMFDLERRFMGGYGIVGGNLPLAAGHRRSSSDYRGTEEVTRLRVRRRRRQPGHVRRDAQPRRAVEAAGRLHGHQQPVRHGHGARAPLRA